MEFDNNIPIYIQVINKIKQDLITGKLKNGDKMPSARDLSAELKINLNTVARVYKELEIEGIVFTKRGIGTYVTESLEKISSIKTDYAKDLLSSFIFGMRKIGFNNQQIVSILKENIEGDYNE
ncbi:GntR family transcriptional regulator [Sedimentibacter sp. zth1]|uniref:GntR family transcriptional regulator n=1 Tax=Sedimentibacter sp. zth1 TaxID=2816908 RepID=UPI001A9230F8|nr:GntR family transcriptional regulator [Sedimentibacter sp. zth1]QSX05526.1 GntR family transcriptional regulator [Sedimentibacter sp. zth1]